MKSRPAFFLGCWIAVLAVFWTWYSAFAAEEQGESSVYLVVEPAFMRPKISWPVPDSQHSVFTLVRIQDEEWQPLTEDEVKTMGVSAEEVAKAARERADALLPELKPEFFRDKNGIIEYATIESETLPLTAAVLAPGFGELFEDTLGPDLLVGMPSRGKLYVFPKLASEPERVAEMIVLEYKAALHPVSRELFELSSGRFRAVGYIR